MKKCQKCNYENADSMRFCLECGTALPDAPIIVSWQDSGTQKPSDKQSSGPSQSTTGQGSSSNPPSGGSSMNSGSSSSSTPGQSGSSSSTSGSSGQGTTPSSEKNKQ